MHATDWPRSSSLMRVQRTSRWAPGFPGRPILQGDGVAPIGTVRGRRIRSWAAVAAATLLFACGGEDGTKDPCAGAASGTACTWAGLKGEEGFNGDGHNRWETKFNQVQDLVFLPDGTAWLSDFNNYLLRRVRTDDTIESMVGWTDPVFPGDGPFGGVKPGGAAGAEWQLNHPTNLIVQADGSVLLVAWHNHKLLSIDPNTGWVSVVGGSGAGFAGDGGPVAQALFKQPDDATVDEQGNIYVVDQQNERIRMIDPEGIISTLAGTGTPGYQNGPSTEAQFSWAVGSNPNPSGGIVHHEGKLYVADTENNRVRVVDLADSSVSTIAGTGEKGFGGDGGAADQAQLSAPRDLEIGPEGDLYFADTDNGAVRAVDLEHRRDPDGGRHRRARARRRGEAARDRDAPQTSVRRRLRPRREPLCDGLAQRSNREGGQMMKRWMLLFIPGALAGYGCGDGQKECDTTVPGNICTIAGTGENGYDPNADTTVLVALEAKMSLPQDTLPAPDGTLYISDWNNHRIRHLDADGMLSWVAGRGELGGSLDDPANGDFNHPPNIIFDRSGENIIIAAWHNSKVRTLNIATGEVVDTCGDGKRAYFGDDGPALSSSLDLPASLAFDPDGNLVIMDEANQVLRYVDAAGDIHLLAGRCLVDAPAPAGPGPCGAGVEPVQCPAGPNGPSGKWTCGDPATFCKKPCSPSYSGDEISASELRMAQPFGQSAIPAGRIVFDPAGNLYFADTSNNLIRMIDTDGVVHRLAGQPPVDGVPKAGYAGDGGPASDALLDTPVDLALGDDGTLFFTDVNNHCVRAIAPDQTIRTVAGQCGQKGFEGDGGPATSAKLKLPFGVAFAGGRLYLADTGNNVIRTVLLP